MQGRSPSSKSLVAVLGGGISGLTAAYELQRRGHEVVVLDRQATPGGRIQTERRAGFLVEHGPNSMISPAPGAEALIGSLGLDGERIDKGDAVRRRYLVRDGRAHALPLDPLGFFSSSFFSLRGRLRLLAEPFVRCGPDDESVAAFVRRRFGRELLDYVFDPLVGGLYAGDPERLSIAALLPRLKQLEMRYGSVVRGVAAKALAGMDPRYDPRRRMLFSFRQGMATLPQQLAQALGPRLRGGVRVEALQADVGGGFRLSLREYSRTMTLRVQGVVVALPAYAAARVLAPLAADAAQALATIGHPPLAVVALGYRREQIAHPLDGLGALTPTVEQRNILGFLFSSTLFAHRAPDGHILLTAYVGGARQPELAQLPRDMLTALVRGEAQALLGAKGAPVFDSVRYWRHGLPQPDLGHAARLDALRQLELEYPGLAITGNYISGVSTPACVEAAVAAAQRIAGRDVTAAVPVSGTGQLDGGALVNYHE
ncbi:MAG: protoporphyrinogen oxidase [Rhodocyclales bacterium GWA2_65_20]|nr:MAG: protoporphyrinogen oxidase [Rhodocyclales bacterium GWA2_65_20]